MARRTQLTNLVVNTQANALAKFLDGGVIEVFDGTQPDHAESPVSQTPIVSLRLGDPAFRPAVAGTIIANAIAPGVAVRTGRPTWARISRPDGATVMDVSAGTSNCVMTMPVAVLEQGITLTVDLTHTVVKA